MTGSKTEGVWSEGFEAILSNSFEDRHPTASLRFVKRRVQSPDGETTHERLILQQQFVTNWKGDRIWKDIPVVSEDGDHG